MSESRSHKPGASWLARIRESAQSPSRVTNSQPNDETSELAVAARPADGKHALVPFIAALDEPNTIVAEQYRVLASKLEGLWKQPGFQRVAITSTIANEGKSLTTINVAGVLAKDFGRRVLVIDGDFRKPSLWQFVGQKPATGLSDIIADRLNVDSTVQHLRYESLGLLQTGQARINPTRLWKSQAIKDLLAYYDKQYDYLIVDTPPVLTVVDTALITDLMDGVVVVVRSGTTAKAMLGKALASLPRAKLLGTVLNGVKGLRSPLYYYHVR